MSMPEAVILGILEAAGLALLVANFASGFVSAAYGAPYVPTVRKRLLRLMNFGEVRSGDVFYDLGSGDGRVLESAIRDFNVSRAVGYEIAPWPYWKSRFLMRRFSGKAAVFNRSMFEAKLDDATCVYAYLLPKLNERLATKFSNELKPGTRIICPSFTIDTERHSSFRLKKSEKIGNITAYLYERI